MARNIRLILSYDGTNFCGWQIQPNGNSVQAELQKVLCQITGEEVHVTGSGRTDAGVHALGQTANFYTSASIGPERLIYAMNALLPDDIVIQKVEEVASGFHARYDAKGKHYQYVLYNAKIPPVLDRLYVWHITYGNKLNVERMREASSYFLGTHDFKGFMSSGSSVKDTVRTIEHISIVAEGPYITLDFYGNGFLYNMIRIIVGTLIACGIGKIPPEALEEIIASGVRERGGITAPAKGLKLVEVYY